MSILDDIKFQYFPGRIQITKPLGNISLRMFIKSHKNPKPNMVEIFNKIAECEANGDKETKAYLKQQNLFYFNPCVILDGKNRGYANILGFTGLMVVDIDHIDDAEELRDGLFERLKSVVVAYVSPSKRGLKLLVKIPVVKTVEEYKAYFYGLAHALDKIEGFDGTSQNPVLPLFLSMDADLKFREDPETWTTRGMKINEFPIHGVDEDFEPIEASDEDRKSTFRVIASIIRKADEQGVGHTNVRSASLLAGGYCAAGYFSQEEGLNFLQEKIQESDYLSKNLSGYIKTANQMFHTGMSSPIILKDD
jgi:hypothetical protein